MKAGLLLLGAAAGLIAPVQESAITPFTRDPLSKWCNYARQRAKAARESLDMFINRIDMVGNGRDFSDLAGL